ncbi:MAG: hypothetical protein ACM3JD_08960 [Rudaea sp.]
MKRSKTKLPKPRRESPAVVYFWAFGLAILSYVTARIVLDGQPHPYHWLSGLAGGLAGIGIGWLWFRWRGDVF